MTEKVLGKGTKARLFDAELQAARAYWLERLEEPFEPTSPVLNAVPEGEDVTTQVRFDDHLAGAMARLAKGSSFLIYVQLATALHIVLARLSGTRECAFGSPLFLGEEAAEGTAEPASGAVVIRHSLGPEKTFRQLLGETRKSLLEAYAQQDYSLERLRQDLPWAPEGGVFFQVTLGSARLHGETSTWGQAVDLCWTDAEGIELECTSRNLRGTSALRFLGQLRQVLTAGLAHSTAPVSELSVMRPGERHQLLVEWNDTAVRLPKRERLVHRLFEDQVAVGGDRPAAIYGEERLSYRELDARAEALAKFLNDLGVGPEALVGIAMERSFDMLVAVLGVLKAGAAYVPLDPTYPQARLTYMVEDAALSLILSQSRVAERLAGLSVRVVALDGEPLAGVNKEPGAGIPEGGEEGLAQRESRLAYVIYTSGSTGRPKGVAMHHDALFHLICWQLGEPGLQRGKRRLQFASLSFDGSFREIFSTWAVGGMLVLVDEATRQDVPALVRTMAEQEVEKILLPAVMLTRLAEEGRRWPGGLQHLKEVITAGEQVRIGPALVEFFEALPQARLHNHYGPSETHVTSAGALASDPRKWAPLPSIGRPIDNHRLYCLDRRGEPVGIDGVGELHIGGVGVARGYHGRPRRTAASFVPDPFGGESGARLYCTGDLARHDATGALHFLSRRDHQVKIRGFRVEPGEVEAVLGSHPAVREAVVVAREGAGGSLRLVGYFVPRNEGAGEALSEEELRGYLTERLPEYMVPSAWVALSALPVTSNRKVDRSALPDPETPRSGGRGPRTSDEELLVAIWCQVLELAEVGIDEDFFRLGGHSLLATQVISRLRSALGVEVAVRDVFRHPTIAGLATAVAEARQQEMEVPALVERPRGGSLRLSPAQERLWFVQQLDPALVSYNLPSVLRLRGGLDRDALEAAFRCVIERHEILRTAYPEAPEGPRQEILPTAHSSVLPLVDLEALSAERREREMRRLAKEEAARPFILTLAPPMRRMLVRLGEDEHVLLLTLHHIASDGWSAGILIREMMTFYKAGREGVPANLPILPLQYADFAEWQREFLRGEVLERQVAWWRERLADLSDLVLATDRPRRGGRSAAGRSRARLSAALMGKVKAFARRRTATLFMTLLAAFHALLHRVSGQADLAIGAAIANRDRAEIEGLIGFFVNMLVLRAQVHRDTTVSALLDDSREMALGAYAHQNLPFEKLVEVLAPERDRHRHPLFQVLLTFQNVPISEVSMPGGEVSALDFGTPSAKYDLLLAAQEDGEELVLGLEYDASLFDATTVARLLRQFERVLEGMAADPEQTVDTLPLLNAAERHQLDSEWNDSARPYPQEDTVHGLFEEWARKSPEAQALAFGDEGTMSYGELDRQANMLAQVLVDAGVVLETPVAFCLGHTPEMVVASLAILKAGGAFVPLDPTWPQEHMAFLLADSGARVLLALGAFREALPEVSHDLKVIWLDEAAPTTDAPSVKGVLPTGAADHLAYLMYTSGSTGRPKGVAVRHRGIVRLVRGSEFAPLGPADRVAQGSTPAFDAATFEIWGALLNGGCLVLLEREAMLTPTSLQQTLEHHAVTAMFLTTPLFNQLARQEPTLLASVGQVVVGGDAIDPEAARGVLASEPAPRLVNGYGPTEGTTFSTWHAISPGLPETGRVPIGRAVANTTVHVLDRNMVPSPIGVPGQLFLSGAGLARGYHGRPARTAKTFLPDPASGSASSRPLGARLYATGDLVRTLADGAMDFLGRIDHQVKIRGFRIEPGEVEVALRAYPEVTETVVVVRGEPSDRSLVAYVVGEVDAAEMRKDLRQKLPDFMIPSAIVPLDSMPLNANGKVDRGALPDPQAQRSQAWEAPATAMEEQLAAIWSELLGYESIGREDDFFALGGHSLKVTQVASRVRESLGLELPLGEFFARTTLVDQATWIEQELEQQKEDAAPAGTDLDDLLAELDDMSDEEAERLLAAEEAVGNGDEDHQLEHHPNGETDATD